MVNFILVAPPECQLDLCVKVKLGGLFMSKMCLELDFTLTPTINNLNLFLMPVHYTIRFMFYSIMSHETLHKHF